MQLPTVFSNPDFEQPKHLVYVEWFTKFAATPDAHYDMYKVLHAVQGATRQRLASVIRVSDISCSASIGVGVARTSILLQRYINIGVPAYVPPKQV